MSLRGSFSYHEFAIRAVSDSYRYPIDFVETCCYQVLASIESAANRYKRHIVPVISFQVRLPRMWLADCQVLRCCGTHQYQPIVTLAG